MRLRLTFAKTAHMRYTGHLDLHKTWERVFRRAQLPLAYSQGFAPHPRLNLAAALPLGFTGEAELLDAWLETELDLAAVRPALERALPPGLQLRALEIVPDNLPALQTQITAAEYEVRLAAWHNADHDPRSDSGGGCEMRNAESGSLSGLSARVAALLAEAALPRTRRGKAYDLRPLIECLEALEPHGPAPRLAMRLAAREGATGRPEEVVEALGLSAQQARYHRTRLVFAAESCQRMAKE